MMRRLLLSLALLGSGIVIPMTAAAYVGPEEMLDDGDFSTRFLDPPPSSPREYERIAKEQEAESAALRAAAREKIIAERLVDQAVAEVETKDAVHAAAGEEPGLQSVISATDGDETESLRDARILERVKAQQEVNRLQAQLQWLTQTQSLHSGAPLMSDTGPATVGAVLLLIGTVAIVLGRVRKMEKHR